MIRTKNLFILLIVFFIGITNVLAQGFSHEIGVIAGPVAFYSDYGIRNDMETNTGNMGLGVGIVHYISFAYRADCNCYTQDTYFNDHFKIRNELDYHVTNLDHHGIWAESEGFGGEQLRAMHGKATVTEIGTHLEYFPLSIRDFSAFAYKVAPYVSLGVHYVHYSPTGYSDLGSLTEPGSPAIFPAFEDGIVLDSGNTWAIAGSVGMRYKLSVLSDLLIDARWHWYDSDWVDGLNHDQPQNQANDWMFWINVGYIYYLDF
ncbi:MAG TPA: glutamate dehydrogenase [Salinimicrobium sp.]|nr:glutamate dehydrogenase [Salinimicrobium sp.]